MKIWSLNSFPGYSYFVLIKSIKIHPYLKKKASQDWLLKGTRVNKWNQL
jgi:hypothetical protein